MKQNRKILGLLCLSMLLAACSPQNTKTEEEKLTVVSSFYPVYLLAQEVMEDVNGVQLLNMAQPQTGCLHDYELTIADMKILEQADMLIINGGGMEGFLAQALERYPELEIVDTSHGIELLETGAHHHHAHEEEAEEIDPHAGHDHDEEAEEIDPHAGHDHDEEMEEIDPHAGHDHEGNPHIWLSPERAAMQTEAIAHALGERLPQEAERFHKNAEDFHEEMHALQEQAEEIALSEEQYAAVFHEGFGYLAELFHMEPAVELFADEYQIPSARELAEAAEEAEAHDIRFYLTAADNGQKYAQVLAAERGEAVIVLDPLTMKDENGLSYTERMRNNIEAIEKYEKQK